jgi:hypothetical protein
MPENNNVVLDNVRIIFRNFAGKKGDYNKDGDRNFAILLTDEMAAGLSKAGWNVRTTRERELDGETVGGEPYLGVKVGYSGRPPRVVIITSRGKTDLSENEVGMLDYADITNVDVIVRPYDWDVNGKTGRKAYLKSIYVTIDEDELDLKYADVPTAGGPPDDFEAERDDADD